MPDQHALLSASSSDRWIHCPPSARLSEAFEDPGSSYAAEGTAAHAVCEYKLRKALGMKAENPAGNIDSYDPSMEGYADSYVAFVLSRIAEAKKTCTDPVVLVEQRVDFSFWVEQGFGTCDCLILGDGLLEIVDFKFGMGILVDAKENPQLMCYSLGALDQFGSIYDVETVRLTIFQPRRDNLSWWEISKDDLLRWADGVLKPAADLAFAGEGKFLCGKWCTFCRAKSTCRARADRNIELAGYDFAPAPLLTDEDVEDILGRIDDLVSWANDIKEFALSQAIGGKVWNGYKLVEGKSNRRYVNDDAVADAVEKAGYDPYEKKLLGITAMQKMLGKTRFEQVLAGLVEKPAGKPTLVPESDGRPAMNNAKTDFYGN